MKQVVLDVSFFQARFPLAPRKRRWGHSTNLAQEGLLVASSDARAGAQVTAGRALGYGEVLLRLGCYLDL